MPSLLINLLHYISSCITHCGSFRQTSHSEAGDQRDATWLNEFTTNRNYFWFSQMFDSFMSGKFTIISSSDSFKEWLGTFLHSPSNFTKSQYYVSLFMCCFLDDVQGKLLLKHGVYDDIQRVQFWSHGTNIHQAHYWNLHNFYSKQKGIFDILFLQKWTRAVWAQKTLLWVPLLIVFMENSLLLPDIVTMVLNGQLRTLLIKL